MNSRRENRNQEDFRQLASALGAEVQRLHVFFSLYENALVQGALPSSVKHLVALAMAIGKRSSFNIVYHVDEALRAGASRDEIRETVTVAVMVAGITSLPFGLEALASVTQCEARKMCSGCSAAANDTRG